MHLLNKITNLCHSCIIEMSSTVLPEIISITSGCVMYMGTFSFSTPKISFLKGSCIGFHFRDGNKVQRSSMGSFCESS